MSQPAQRSALPSLSVVIPAHNEEATIGMVLGSLLPQLDDITEIIVVDNNCADRTVEVVESHRDRIPSLRVVVESRPGVIAARNAGFDEAVGDVIGRVDADTRAQPGWARAVREFFSSADETTGAISGPFDQYDMPLQGLHRAIMSGTFSSGSGEPKELESLYGANMAITRPAWDAIRSDLLDRNGIFDDLDITLCLREHGLRSLAAEQMRVSTSGRRALSSLSEYRRFTDYLPATFEARGMHDQVARARRATYVMRALHLALWIPSRMWDPTKRGWDPRRLIRTPESRALPYTD